MTSEMNKEGMSEESLALKKSDSIKSPHLISESYASKHENSIQHHDKRERISSAHTQNQMAKTKIVKMPQPYLALGKSPYEKKITSPPLSPQSGNNSSKPSLNKPPLFKGVKLLSK